MAKYLITPSLYSSFLYYAKGNFDVYEDPEKAKEMENKAREDFLNTLNKVKSEPSEAMIRGINFENLVSAICEGKTPVITPEEEPEVNCAIDIAEKVRGGTWQVVLQKDIGKYLLYGKADVIKRDIIFDIKRTSSYDIGKYQDSIQHLLYLECTKIDKFEYLICDGKNLYGESYFKQSNNLQILTEKIEEMVAWIKSAPEFAEPFEKNWIAREQ